MPLLGYAAAALVAATAVGALDQTQIQLELNGGLIEGLLVQNDTSPVERYLGVPFAKPPIGDLRWQVSLSSLASAPSSSCRQCQPSSPHATFVQR